MTNRFWLAAGSAAALCAQASASSKEPRFEDYPADVDTHLKPAAPQFKTGGQRRFRTMIRESVEKGVNFAGHYTIAEWGCGSGCMQMAVVDLRTGDVYDGPFGALPKARMSLIPNADVDKTGIFYQEDSSLFIARGCPNEKACGAYFFEWTGAQFKLLRRIHLKSPPGAEKP
jgi:hypothetical protein